MSLIKKELTEKSGFTMEFSVSKEVYEKAEYEAYKKNVKSINVPGFRKGKAPKAIIERYYGKGIFFEDAINACIPEAFEAAVKEAELNIVGQPQFDIVSTDGDIVLKAVGFVKPEVTIEGYKGIKVEKKVDTVKAADVTAELENVRKRNARTVEVTDRAAKMGDIANIDYEGSVDGVPFDGGKGEGHDLTLGSGSFIPGFEDQIVGKSIGEEFDVNVTFPEEYHAKELAGKAVVFKCKLNGITAEELPELDDEFAKDLSFDTFEEYKADVKKKLEEKAANAADRAVEGKLNDMILDILEVEVPEAMYQNEMENQVRDYDMQLRQNGLDLNTYFKYTGQNLDQLRENFRPRAERAVKTRLALEAIVTAESITATEDEINDEYKKIADMYQIDVENVKAAIESKDLAGDLCVRKAFDLVKENAVITDVAPKADAE